MVKCPRCNLQVNEVYSLDGELAEKFAAVDPGGVAPSAACKECISEMRKTASSHSGSAGSALLAEAKAKETQKMQLWKSRVQLVRQARSFMDQKMLSDAAVQYEKYIRLLEIVFDAPRGGLNPEHFKEKARTQELTIICSVYWDLIRIYDTNDAYGSRQAVAATELAKFIPYTPIFPDIIKKAESFARTARHPQVVKSFIKQALRQRPRCFIATSAFASPTAPEVLWLRYFRDSFLRRQTWGRHFIAFYYRHSPRIADFLDKQNWLKPAVRQLLRVLIRLVAR